MRTKKREPDSLAPRSRSRIPSHSPNSQCGCGSKEGVGCSPHWRTTVLADSSRPSGTWGRGRLGRPQQQLLELVLHLARLLLQASGAIAHGGDVAAQVGKGVLAAFPAGARQSGGSARCVGLGESLAP